MTHPKTIVLIVEDDEIWRQSLASTLITDGKMIVHTAPDAHTALALLQKHPEIRVVITDNHLGAGLNGVELIRTLQTRPAWAALSFILHHGDCEKTLRVQLKDVLRLRFVSKVRPHSVDIILAIHSLVGSTATENFVG